MPDLELYGTAGCPYTRDMREWLEFSGQEFVEYDVEIDGAARARLRALAGGRRMVPVLVDGGKVVRVGWQGQGCTVNLEPTT